MAAQRSPVQEMETMASGKLTHKMKVWSTDMSAKVVHKEARPDSSWHVALLACLLICLAAAPTRASGFLYVGVMDQYAADHQQASWPICLSSVMNNMAGLVAGPLCQKFGVVPVLHAGSMIMWMALIASSFAPNITWLAVTMGAMFGFGSGTTFTMLHIFINQHFDKYKGLALGTMYTGCTVSGFIFPRLLLYLSNTYGFRGCMLIFGAIMTHGTALTSMLKMSDLNQVRRARPKSASKAEKEASMDAKAESILHSLPEQAGSKVRSLVQNKSLLFGLTVLRSPVFYVILLTYLVLNFTFGVFMTTVVDFAIERRTSVTNAVSLVPLFSITDTFGRLGLPVLADRGYMRRSTLMMLNYLSMGLFLFALPFSTSYGTMLAVCLLVALFLGCGLPMYAALMAEYIGMERLPIAYGFVGAAAGPLFLLNPLFIGYFRDNVGSYDSMYKTLASALMLLGATWMAVVCVERKKRRGWHLKLEQPNNEHTGCS